MANQSAAAAGAAQDAHKQNVCEKCHGTGKGRVLGGAAKSKRMGGACPKCKGRGRIEPPPCIGTVDDSKPKAKNQSMFALFRKSAQPATSDAKAEPSSIAQSMQSIAPLETPQTAAKVQFQEDVKTQEGTAEEVRMELQCEEEAKTEEPKIEEMQMEKGELHTVMEADERSEASDVPLFTTAPREEKNKEQSQALQTGPIDDRPRPEVEPQFEQVGVLKGGSSHKLRQVSIESAEKFVQCSRYCCIVVA